MTSVVEAWIYDQNKPHLRYHFLKSPETSPYLLGSKYYKSPTGGNLMDPWMHDMDLTDLGWIP
jgi:hypothetical protein